MSYFFANAITKQIDSIYSEILGINFLVIDAKFPDGSVGRHILRESGVDGVESAMDLIAPEGADFKEADTRTWKVDRRISYKTFEGLVVAPFLVSALSVESTGEGEKYLEIGLGGGTIHAFFGSQKPKMDMTTVEYDGAILKIAQKWFGIDETEHRRQIEADGRKVIAEFKAAGKKVNALYLDTSDDDVDMPAPSHVFLHENLIEDMKSLLTADGCLVVNTAWMSKEARQKGPTKDISLFKKVFPHIFQLKMRCSDLENNNLLICQTKPQQSMEFYADRLKDVSSALGLQITPENVELCQF